MRPPPPGLAAILLVATLAAPSAAPRQTVFKGGVNLVNVTATVTDQDGRFVQGLRKEDFVIYDDETPQEIVQFTSERVPVSLGVLLDVSGSMTEEKMASARAAITRFAYDHLAPDDELFLAEFASRTEVLQTWTRDRGTFSRALDRTRQGRQRFGTAVYDAVREALFMASTGTHPKKALLVISDGQDTRSRTPAKKLQALIRASEVLVYALGVDQGPLDRDAARGVNTDVLRAITSQTGGRMETVRGFTNLDAATARLAAELSQQYVMAYAAPSPGDGRWHSIKVNVRGRGLIVRARAGYAS